MIGWRRERPALRATMIALGCASWIREAQATDDPCEALQAQFADRYLEAAPDDAWDLEALVSCVFDAAFDVPELRGAARHILKRKDNFFALADVAEGLGHHDVGEIARCAQWAVSWRSRGPDDIQTWHATRWLAGNLQTQGRYREAVALLQWNVDTSIRAWGENDSFAATSMTELAVARWRSGALREALPLLERAFSLRLSNGTLISSQGYLTTRNLTVLLNELGEHDRALERLRVATDVACGADRDASFDCEELGRQRTTAQMALGNMEFAAQALLEAEHGSNSLDVGLIHIALGDGAAFRDDHVTASKHYTLAHDVCFEALAQWSNRKAASSAEARCWNLSADRYLESAMWLDEPNELLYWVTWNELLLEDDLEFGALAWAHRGLGNYDDASKFAADYVAASQRLRGASHPSTANAWEVMAWIGLESGALELGEQAAASALSIRRASLGPDHPLVARSLYQLASIELNGAAPDEAQAVTQLLEAFTITGEDLATLTRAQVLAQLGQWLWRSGDSSGSEELLELALGDYSKIGLAQSDQVITVKRALAEIVLRDSQAGRASTSKRALELLRQASSLDEARQLADVWRGTESERRHGLEMSTELTRLTLATHLGGLLSGRDADEFAAQAALRSKSRSLDMEARLARAGTAQSEREIVLLVRELRAKASAIEQLSMNPPDDPAYAQDWRTRIRAAQEEHDRLARSLADNTFDEREMPPPALVADLIAHIHPGMALVEWVVWEPYDPNAAWTDRWGGSRYGAYVFRADGLAGWADLGPTHDVDIQVHLLREAAASGGDTGTPAAAIADRVLTPLAKHLRGANHVVLSPDGALNLAPLDLLPAGSAQIPLGQSHTVTLVSSGRDLLTLDSDGPEAGPAIIIAAADFDARMAKRPGDIDPAGEPSPHQQWPDLPGTDREGRAVHGLLPRSALLTGARASEASVKEARAPAVLHVATHGFFLDDAPSTQPSQARGIPAPFGYSSTAVLQQSDDVNPLLRSGIVLAGANANAGDGYLTALEVMYLDLQGTEMAVLSACETGVGAVQTGDGVQGLRRALVLAGARTQVVSLWKVDDAATAVLMEAFYTYLGDGVPRGEALQRAKRDIAATPGWEHPRYWAAFTLSGDWRPIEFD